MKISATLWLFLLLLIGFGAWWGLQKGWFTGERHTDKLFGISDTSGVTRIYLVNKQGEAVTLENKQGMWMVNGQYPAAKGWLHQMFKTIMRIQVKAPVSGPSWNTIVRQLAGKHIKVEIYNGEEKIRSFFVGAGTPDGKGTYMMVEGAEQPYICEVPGFEGEVSHHFPTDFMMWRSRMFLDFAPESIEKINVVWNMESKESFGAIQERGKGIKAFLLPEGNFNFDTLAVAALFSRFKEVHAEAFIRFRTRELLDSLATMAKPFCTLTLCPFNKPCTVVNFYSKSTDLKTKTTFLPDGSPVQKDPDRYLAVVNGVKDVYLVQDFVFGNKLLRARDIRK